MGMVVRTNTMALNAYRQLGMNNRPMVPSSSLAPLKLADWLMRLISSSSWSTSDWRASPVAKSLEKLSSGFRINRASDDAAGLAISEKMKAQITGLETASSNAQAFAYL